MSVDDEYAYSVSGGVRTNAAGVRDHAQLGKAMNDVASFVLAKIYTLAALERLDLEYLRVIHVSIFGDLLPGVAGRIGEADVQATWTESRPAGPTSSGPTSARCSGSPSARTT
jgi:cell filamentation protein